MAIFYNSIIAVEFTDDGPKTRERLETQLGMDDTHFVYNNNSGEIELVLSCENGQVTTAPLGNLVFRDDAGELRSLPKKEFLEQYGAMIEGTEDFATEECRKLFAALPMRGKTQEEISRQRSALMSVAEAYFGESFELIDSYFEEDPPEGLAGDKAGIWYLGKAIMALAEADVAVFGSGWPEARGCHVEYDICRHYGIPVLETTVAEPYDWYDRRIDPEEKTDAPENAE